MPPVCRIPSSQVWNAYLVYQSGMSIAEISRQVYRKLGYATVDACNTALRREFRRRGYRLRTASQAMSLAFVGDKCAECGCELFERTPRCDRCNARHGTYKRKGRPYVEASCGGCGGAYSHVTAGCRACRERAKFAAAPRSGGRGKSHGSTRTDRAGGGTNLKEAA